MKYSLFIGRYQPFHDGHKALIQKVLDEGKNVLIAVRDCPDDKDNPWRSGHQWVLRMDKAREIFTKDVCDKGAAFIDISLAKALGLPVADVTPKAES